MISRTTTRAGARITFTVAARAPVSVVGDFNGWDPAAHPMQSRAGGLRSVTVALAPGTYAFRYLADGGLFFDDPDADAFAGNEHGGIDGVVVVADAAPPVRRAAAKSTAKNAPAKKPAKATAKASARKSAKK